MGVDPIELTLEERLTLENLRLKIQMAEVQKAHTSAQLTSYTKELLRKYQVPSGATVSLTESHLLVSALGSNSKTGSAQPESADDKAV